MMLILETPEEEAAFLFGTINADALNDVVIKNKLDPTITIAIGIEGEGTPT